MGLSSLTGGGSLSSGGGGPSQSGAASGSSGTGTKTFNIGGNPNITSGSLVPILIILAVVAGIYFYRKAK